ncbi:MAG: hypothetical protein AB7F99_15040 [Vicinamibacterales bacterium]
MSAFRRHLRILTVAWLVCQVVVLSAFAPQCCLAHMEGHASHTEECTDTSIPASHCPMRAETGEACPMHRQMEASEHAGHAGHHAGATAEPAHAVDHGDQASTATPAPADCTMRGICNGPSVAIAGLFPLPAVLADATARVVDYGVSPVMVPVDGLTNAPVLPDTPPPRV